MSYELTYGGKDLSEFGLVWDNKRLFDKPEAIFTRYEIPTRNGDLLQANNKFKNVQVSYRCYISRDFKNNYSNLINYLNSFDTYQRLENTLEMDTYRMGVFHSAIDPDVGAFALDGWVTLVFDCKPQEFYKYGDEYVSIGASDTVLRNPSYQKSKPIFKMTVPSKLYLNGEKVIDAYGMLDWAETPITPGDLSWQVFDGYVRIQGTQSTDFERYIAYLTVPPGTYSIKLNGGDYRSLVQLKIDDGTTEASTFINTDYTLTATEKTEYVLSIFIQSYTQVDDDFTLTLTGQPETILVDCELMDAYYDNGMNANPFVELSEGFIELASGDSVLRSEGTVEVQPKWWRL